MRNSTDEGMIREDVSGNGRKKDWKEKSTSAKTGQKSVRRKGGKVK